MAAHGKEDRNITGGHVVPPGEVHVHIHSTKLYASILGALLFLTIVTVAVSYVDVDGFLAMGREVEGVGAWNLGIAILVATMKASLVVTFFMHLKDDSRFNALVFVGGLLFVGVFFAYTMNDTATRGETGDAFNGVTIDPETGLRAPGGITGEIHGLELEEGLAVEEEEPAPAAPESGAEAAAAGGDEGEAADAEALPEEAEGGEAIEEAGEGAVEETGDALGVEPDVDEPAPEAGAPEAAPSPQPQQQQGAAPAPQVAPSPAAAEPPAE